MLASLVALLRALAIAGFLLFAGAFAALAVAPQAVERRARAEVVAIVRAEIVESFPALGAFGRALEPALDFLCRYDCSGDALGRLTVVLEPIRAGLTRLGLTERLGVMDRVTGWVRGRYDDLVGGLVRDLRIFTGVNAILFLLAFLALRAIRKLPPSARGRRLAAAVAAILILTALGASALYLFGQNWIHTILLGSYLGWGYLVYVALIAAVLSDVAFNRGRVLGAIASALGGHGDAGDVAPEGS